jgi:hypothetical protein
MKKKILIIMLLVFCWLIGGIGNLTDAEEAVVKVECGLQIKNFSEETVDV